MPPRNQTQLPRPSPAEAEIVRAWIEQGAKPIPQAAPRPHQSLPTTLAIIRDYLAKKNNGQERAQTRFFTLDNLWNNHGVEESELRYARAALSKAINSLSWKEGIVLPVSVDAPNHTVLAINLADYGWTNEHWDAIVRAYPYGLAYDNHRDGSLNSLDKDITRLTKSFVTNHVRLDWFVSTALQPRLYHSLLYDLSVPRLKTRENDNNSANPKQMTDRDLESHLGIDVERNLFGAGPRPLRSGFTHSLISSQNRMIEVHTFGIDGYYWKSYDFAASTRRGLLPEFPLGPTSEKNPNSRVAFQHDGGEIIFTLPNGLQGYLLVAATGARLDAGPIEIVGDSLRTSGTQAVVNGLSCVACHRLGMIDPPPDEIRMAAAVFGDVLAAVQQLYAQPAEMTQVVNRSRERFTVAAERTMQPFLMAGKSDAPFDMSQLPEPVSEVSRRFLLEPLDIETIASELYEPNAAFLREAVTKIDGLRGLGIGTVANRGGLKRAAWESKRDGGSSLMQDTAELFGFVKKTSLLP
jgi:serine/threonine-protein kinase